MEIGIKRDCMAVGVSALDTIHVKYRNHDRYERAENCPNNRPRFLCALNSKCTSVPSPGLKP